MIIAWNREDLIKPNWGIVFHVGNLHVFVSFRFVMKDYIFSFWISNADNSMELYLIKRRNNWNRLKGEASTMSPLCTLWFVYFRFSSPIELNSMNGAKLHGLWISIDSQENFRKQTTVEKMKANRVETCEANKQRPLQWIILR